MGRTREEEEEEEQNQGKRGFPSSEPVPAALTVSGMFDSPLISDLHRNTLV